MLKRVKYVGNLRTLLERVDSSVFLVRFEKKTDSDSKLPSYSLFKKKVDLKRFDEVAEN